MRPVWLVLAVLLTLAGCTTAVSGRPAGSSAPDAGGIVLAVPVEMRPVVEGGTPSATVLPDTTGEDLTLAEPVLTLRELTGAEVELDQGQWALVLELTQQDGATFADLTADRVGERLAMVIDDRVVVAPTIAAAITGGVVHISGNYTEDDVRDLLGKLTGG